MPSHRQPIVTGDVLVIDGAVRIPVGSSEWYGWLEENVKFRYEGGTGHFGARCESRRGSHYWYAYRWREGKLSKAYLGRSLELTPARLAQASARLASRPSDSLDWVIAPDTERPTKDDLAFLSLTKVRPPALPNKLVTRERLTRRINGQITLLTAPSGFGKSTLLNEWRRSCGIPVAWVSLDADDNQPLRFWSAVTAALQTIFPSLTLPSSTNLSEIIVSLTNAVICASEAPGLPSHLGLVLDDYHHIQDKEIHASVHSWLEHMPPNLQVVLSSHTRPPLPWGEMRAKSMVAEIGTDDLRFTLEEGIGYLSQHVRGSQLAFGEMQAIVKRTEGWAAGLALALLALDQPGQQPIETFTGAHNFVREYFIESILYRQPPSVQEFLLETAVLKHLTGSLCDAVTGRSDGDEMLSYLWQENLFVVRMEEPGWYRYHDLFAETLCAQLQQQLGPGVPRLHRRAAEWYRNQNAPADAVYHLLAIEAWEEAAALIESIALRELEQSGNYSHLMSWLRQLPGNVFQQHKTLLRVYVRVAALALSRTEMNRFLTRIETNIACRAAIEQSAEEQSVLAEIMRIRSLWSKSDTGVSLLSPSGEHDDVWEMLDGIIELARFLRHEYGQAEALAQELYDLACGRRHLYVMLIAGGVLAVHVLLDGYTRRSEKIAREVLEQAVAQRGQLPEPACIALVALSQSYYERNDLAHAHQLLLRAAEVDPNPTSSNMPIMESILRAKIQCAQGDGVAALATLDAARGLQRNSPSALYREWYLIVYQAWVCARQKDYAGAERRLSEAGPGETHSLAAIVRAELCLNQGQPAAAVDILGQLIKDHPRGFYFEPILGARVLFAVALFKQNQVNPARHAMAEAIRLAAPENSLRPFLDYGREAVPLLRLVLHTLNLAQEAQSFARRVLTALGDGDDGQQAPSREDLLTLSAAASITAREQDVLRLVSAGLSNREIATQFSTSESTIKTHLKNIYRKLKVDSRTRAAAQARVLKLV